MSAAKFALRAKVKDQITGLEGTVVARTEWLNGCWRYTLQPALDKDGKMPDTLGFDELQLTLVEETAHIPSKNTGGPRDEPRQAVAK